jgi:hypothetical protein
MQWVSLNFGWASLASYLGWKRYRSLQSPLRDPDFSYYSLNVFLFGVLHLLEMKAEKVKSRALSLLCIRLYRLGLSVEFVYFVFKMIFNEGLSDIVLSIIISIVFVWSEVRAIEDHERSVREDSA